MENYEIDHYSRIRRMAPECMVLLKSDGSFPACGCKKTALYGNGARHTVKGGTGSGDVYVRDYTTIEQGLKNAGVKITTEYWLDEYDNCYNSAWQKYSAEIKKEITKNMVRPGLSEFLAALGVTMPEPEYDIQINGGGDTAVYVLSRISGEGGDRAAGKGDFALSDTEIRDIRVINKKYSRFLLVLNVGGPIDLTPVLDEVNNILLISQPGMAVGDSFTDVFLGKSYPSGKLAATWAELKDYYSGAEFGNFDDTHYKEGIYVGYRYFDTLGIKPIFPFGYGLGFTNFEFETIDTYAVKSEISIKVAVKNTGAYKGKEVIQCYLSLPQGKLDQPYHILVAYAKTKELLPNEKTIVSLNFDLRDFASYNYESSSKILESGEYLLSVGNSSDNTQISASICLKDDITVERVSHIGGKPDFKDWIPPRKVSVEIPNNCRKIELSKYDFEAPQIPNHSVNNSIKAKAERIVEKMSDSDLAYMCVGNFKEVKSNCIVGNAGIKVAGSAGETSDRFLENGLPPLVLADGPAGIRISTKYGKDENGVYSIEPDVLTPISDLLPDEFLEQEWKNRRLEARSGEEFEHYFSAIPIGTAIAQSWNLDIAEEFGNIVGDEMEHAEIDLWLAPALNIQRYPLNGRNFEYYSEDPLISGNIAARVTLGVQLHTNKGVTLKHFVCNNQETNRMYSNSVVSERALRDIYLKGFEIAVKKANPMSVMSSYNLLNGLHTSARRDLLEDLLRGEWKYNGFVMTDWIASPNQTEKHKYPAACSSACIKNGNDLVMPGGRLEYEELLNSLNNGNSEFPITRKNLEKCASRIIEAVLSVYGEFGN